MATVSTSELIKSIGETAGVVWKLVRKKGPLPLTQIVKEVDAPRDIVMQAIGWLAREDKLTLEEVQRRKIASLL